MPGSVCGFVRDRFNLKSIGGAKIIATNIFTNVESKGDSSVVVFGRNISQNNGFYKIDLPDGIFQLSVQADQYVSNKIFATIDHNDIIQDIMLVNERKAKKIQNDKKVDFDDIYYDE